MKKSFV